MSIETQTNHSKRLGGKLAVSCRKQYCELFFFPFISTELYARDSLFEGLGISLFVFFLFPFLYNVIGNLRTTNEVAYLLDLSRFAVHILYITCTMLLFFMVFLQPHM